MSDSIEVTAYESAKITITRLLLGDASDIVNVTTEPDELCDAEVTRDGELEPCDKPAVAVLRWEFDGDTGSMPVCVHHCRVGHMVLLAELLTNGR